MDQSADEAIERMREERRRAEQRFQHDPHRPRYHFLPPENWMNDPNGPIWFDGRYHLFYQHNPAEAKWGDIHWGHAASADLIHWEDWPIALAPTTEGIDTSGCYTGCAFIQEDGTPTIAYTGVPTREGKPGVRSDNQSLAVSHDGMVTWEKIEQNPVIGSPPEGLDVTGFRDPCVWREGDTWYMVVGSGIEGCGGTALLYRSGDLLDWEYLGPLTLGDPDRHGTMWECPDFFPLGERYVLLVSTLGRQMYLSGGWHREEFTPTGDGWADPGHCFYAGKSFQAPDGRRILWGWLREAREQQAQLEAGWSGVMSLPRVLEMGRDGSLTCEPAEELERLRGRSVACRDIALRVGEERSLSQIDGDCLEIEAEVAMQTTGRFTLAARCAPGGEEHTSISFDAREERLEIDTMHASLSEMAEGRVSGASLTLAPGEPLRLRVFLDRSVLEVFANGRACIAERIYPTRPDSTGLRIAAEGGPVSVRRLNIWQMRSIWRSD